MFGTPRCRVLALAGLPRGNCPFCGGSRYFVIVRNGLNREERTEGRRSRMTRFVHVVEQLLCGGAIAKWH